MKTIKNLYSILLLLSIQSSIFGSENGGVELSQELRDIARQEKELEAQINKSVMSEEDKNALMQRYLDDSKKLADIELATRRTEQLLARYDQIYDDLKAQLEEDRRRLYKQPVAASDNIHKNTRVDDNVVKGQGYDYKTGVAAARTSPLTSEEQANSAQGVQQGYGGPIITPITRKGESRPGVTRTARLTAEERAHGAQVAK